MVNEICSKFASSLRETKPPNLIKPIPTNYVGFKSPPRTFVPSEQAPARPRPRHRKSHGERPRFAPPLARRFLPRRRAFYSAPSRSPLAIGMASRRVSSPHIGVIAGPGECSLRPFAWGCPPVSELPPPSCGWTTPTTAFCAFTWV